MKLFNKERRKLRNKPGDRKSWKDRGIWRGIMLYAYIPLSIMYMETLLRILCGYRVIPGLHFALLVSGTAGLIINAVALLFSKPKVCRCVAGVMTGLVSVVFALEYFMYSTYKVFMSFDTIFIGTGGIVSEFSSVLFTAIGRGLPVIIGFLLPLIGFILITRKAAPYVIDEKKARYRRVATLVCVAALFIAGQVVIIQTGGKDKAAYSLEYDFDSTSRRLGILTGLSLDIRYNLRSEYTDAVFQSEEFAWEYSPPTTSRPSATGQSVTPGGESPGHRTLPDPDNSGDSDDSDDHDDSDDPGDFDDSDETVSPTPPEPVVYGYNVIDIDFDTLIAGERNSGIRSIHEYVANLEGSLQNEFTGLFSGKNLILITAEAFSREVVSEELTPTLYRLVHNGFYFSDYYQPVWGGGTSSGEFSVLAGIAPASAARSVQRTVGKNLCFMIGNKLMNLGYFSASYHNGSHTYYNRNRTHTNFGYSTFTAFGSGMNGHVNMVWPASDLEMMEFSLPQYIDNQPFSVYYMTVSGHCNYLRGANAMTDKNWDAVPQPEGMSNRIRAYLACNLELEYALEYLISELEAAGIADDTVIALSTDHYPYGLERSEAWGNDRDYLSELYGFRVRTVADRDHSALIIWSACLENDCRDYAIEVSSPVHSLDILPTLCNLFGLEYDSRLLAGRDVFSNTEALVFWPDRSWITDLGCFNASSGSFTPVEGVEVPDGYIDRIRSIVNNKITYSNAAINNDYFNYLFYPDGSVRDTG